MNSIFRKLYNFSKQYPQFGLEVSIESNSDEDIDQFYGNQLELTSQIMYNPRYSMIRQKPTTNISENSKKIKKDKNPHQIKVAKRLKGITHHRLEELKPVDRTVSLEEGEEDPNADIAMLQQQEILDFDIDDKPQDYLIDEY